MENDNITIYMFEEDCNHQTNALKQFIHYLRFSGKKGIIDFSFSNGIDSIHNQLSLKENLILDAATNTLIQASDDSFYRRISLKKNIHLQRIIDELGNLDQIPKDLSKDKIELLAMAKTILAQTENVLLCINEEHLSNEQILCIKNAILSEIVKGQRKFFLRPSNPNLWLDLVSHFIVKDQNKNFNLVKNTLKTENKIQEVAPLLPIKLEEKNSTSSPRDLYHFSLKKRAA